MNVTPISIKYPFCFIYFFLFLLHFENVLIFFLFFCNLIFFRSNGMKQLHDTYKKFIFQYWKVTRLSYLFHLIINVFFFFYFRVLFIFIIFLFLLFLFWIIIYCCVFAFTSWHYTFYLSIDILNAKIFISISLFINNYISLLLIVYLFRYALVGWFRWLYCA